MMIMYENNDSAREEKKEGMGVKLISYSNWMLNIMLPDFLKFLRFYLCLVP